jgi:hypothetical protein
MARVDGPFSFTAEENATEQFDIDDEPTDQLGIPMGR